MNTLYLDMKKTPSPWSSRIVIIALLLIGVSKQSFAAFAHLTLQSQPGDFVGGGNSYDIIYTPQNSILFSTAIRPPFVSGQPALLEFSFAQLTTPDNYALLDFGTNQLNIPIQDGTYTNAQRAIFAEPGHPGLDISFDHRGCNTLTGNFTITDVSFQGGAVNSFATSFEQHCEGATPALFGSFSYSATAQAPVPVPASLPLFVSGFMALGALLRRFRKISF